MIKCRRKIVLSIWKFVFLSQKMTIFRHFFWENNFLSGQDICDSRDSRLSSLGCAWELRCLEVLKCMSSANDKCRAVIEIVKRADLPWSNALSAAASKAAGECQDKFMWVELTCVTGWCSGEDSLVDYGALRGDPFDSERAQSRRKVPARFRIMHCEGSIYQILGRSSEVWTNIH